jgi:F-type H+-transporting ATPase subunit a
MITLLLDIIYSPFEESRVNSIMHLISSMHLIEYIECIWSLLSLDFFTYVPDFTMHTGQIGFLSNIVSILVSDYAYYYVCDVSNSLFFFYTSYINSYFFGLFESNYYVVILLVSLGTSYYFFYYNKAVIFLYNGISEFVYNNMVLPYIGLDGKRYFPFFIYLFLFILFSNIIGIIPGFFAITSHFSVTLFFSSICWFSIFLVGIYIHGFRFFASFYPSKVPFILSPFLMFIEFISYIVRLASLSLRLFANIVAGHILLDTISMFFYHLDMSVENSINIELFSAGFILWLFLLIMILFEILIALLQAYIFVVLSVIYLNDSIHLHV